MVLIRRATPADIPQIKALEAQSATAAHWTTEQYDAVFSADPTSRFGFVAESGTDGCEIFGFVIARSLAEDWEIENVVVDARHKKQGIGAALLRRLLSEAQAADAASIILEVRESNAPALRLYESNGFRPEGRRKGYYQAPVEDAILYRRALQFCDKIP
jgi:ribosomal-protein-alanine N-acetyltransferase